MLQLFKLTNDTLAEMRPEELVQLLQEPDGLDRITVALLHDARERPPMRIARASESQCHEPPQAA